MRLRTILGFAAIVEIATGLALMIDPAIVVRLLLGAGEASHGMTLARVAGIAMLALGVACWPGQPRAENGAQGFLALLIYNVLIALLLTYLSTVDHTGGVLLWPAVVLHAALALLLVFTQRGERRAVPVVL